MPPAATKPPTQRKRNRKRKRRAASSSESSSSSSSDSSSDEETQTIVKPPPVAKSLPADESSSSGSSSDSSSDDEDAKPITARGRPEERATALKTARKMTVSPSPPPAALPSFLPSNQAGTKSEAEEQKLKDRFRQFWMASVVDGFQDDLEEIRKEPNFGPSRLALLIDSLASGADVFNSSNNNTGINEMEVVLN